jgi:hypothetical protein
MAGTDQQPPRVVKHPAGRPAKHVHHGRTPAAWAGTSIAMLAFVVGGIAVVIQNWPLFWASAAVLVVSLIVTKVLQAAGHGAR